MKNPLLISLLALSLAVLACGGLLFFTFPLRSEVAEPVPESVGPDIDLLARFDALTEQNRVLQQRLAALEVRPAPATRERTAVGAEFVSMEQFLAFQDELQEALAERVTQDNVAPTASPEFKAQLVDTLSEIQREQAIEKIRSSQEKRLARLDESLPKIEDWLGLSPQQSGAMRSALLNQFDREAELVRRWEAGEDRQLLGEQKTTDREAHRAELSQFLAPEQLKTYLSRGRADGKP